MNKLKKSLLLLFALFALGIGAKAQGTKFITDVMLVAVEGDQVESTLAPYTANGWFYRPATTGSESYSSCVNWGCTSNSNHVIMLLYKTSEYSSSPTPLPVTGFYIHVSDENDSPEVLHTYYYTYHRVPCEGPVDFVNSHGDVNWHCGGKFIHLYYTKEVMTPGDGINDIQIWKDNSSNAVGANGTNEPANLNQGTNPGHDIYMRPIHTNVTVDPTNINVSTAVDLHGALTYGNANVTMVDDITLSSIVRINFTDNLHDNVATLDLNGHTLDRGLINVDQYGGVFHIWFGTMIVNDASDDNSGVIKGAYSSAGAIWNLSTFIFNGGTITENRSSYLGGGIYSYLNTEVIINGGVITNNSAADHGGAIYNEGSLTISNCTITNNSAADHAGAIYNAGNLTISNCTINENTANDVGGIYNANIDNQYLGHATLTNCTLIANSSNISAGALANAIGATEMTLNNCTVQSNTANTNGGGIWNGGTLTINGGDISYNTCYGTVGADGGEYDGKGGGIYHNGVALNMVGNPVVIRNIGGSNTTNNLYLDNNKVITVTGPFNEDTNIGLNAENGNAIFTNGYSTYNSNPPSTYFSADLGSPYFIALFNNEVYQTQSFTVYDEATLNDALSSGANAIITVAADIALTNLVNINGQIIIMDLNGHKLYRNITDGPSSEGHVIYVHNDATLILNNSTGTSSIEGGKALNGGALFIEPGSTVTATGVTFQNNTAAEHAGAIWNAGSLSLTNCTISSNTAGDVGGIYNAVVDGVHCGTASLTNCTLTGNSSNSSAGALGNAEGATTMALDNCTITGNTAGTNGGGIWNGGTLAITGGNITSNTATDNGGGIYHLNGTLNMNGNPVILRNTGNNKANDVYLSSSKVITVTGAFTEGTRIGIKPSSTSQTMTSGYSSYNSGVDPNIYFYANDDYYFPTLSSGEVKLSIPAISYIDADGNTQTHTGCHKLSYLFYAGGTDMGTYTHQPPYNTEWYVVDEDLTFGSRLFAQCNIHLILTDGHTLTAHKGIDVSASLSKSLTIYGQSAQTGTIIVDNPNNYYAGIGGGIDPDELTESNPNGYFNSPITINGGIINVKGGYYAAGIGASCQDPQHSLEMPITINGGNVTATGGNWAAGIGGGRHSSVYPININGGTVHATGGTGSVGIGSGAITSTPVVTSIINLNWTSATDNYYSTGYDGTVTVADGKAFVSSDGLVTGLTGTLTDSQKNSIKNKTIVPSELYNIHVGTLENGTLTVPETAYSGARVTLTVTPDAGFICTNVTVTDENTGDEITVTPNGNDTFIFTMPNANVTINTSIFAGYALDVTGYGTGDGGYYLIASPFESVDPANVAGMTEGEFDLYAFDQAEEKEWLNYEANAFNLVSGKGYLYANSEDVTLIFTGTPYSGNGEVTLSKTDNAEAEFQGWNLVGNPFNETAYIADGRAFYTMNADGSELMASETNSIAPMEGIFVIADEDGETMSFTTSEPANNGKSMLTLNVNQGHGVIDRAIVRFSEGGLLPKFQIKNNSTKVYIQQDNKDYAVVNAERAGEMPVNFKAKENGSYTLSLGTEEVAFSYLHLIDNLTGNDVDLLASPSYTFDAKTTDYESRFKLVFATKDGSSTGSETFAFYSNGSWIISNEGDATLQVIDVNGRILSSETVNGSVSKAVNAAPGVYVIRLVNSKNVKTQKIVVR